MIVVEQQRTVERLTVLVDDLDVLEQPVERLALADLRGELADGVLGLVGLADRGGLLADLQGDPGVLGVDVVLVDLERLGGGDGAQRQVELGGPHRLLAHRLDELAGVLPGGLQPLLERDALALEALRRCSAPAPTGRW